MAEVETGVDGLMKLVKEKERISLSDAAKILETPESTVQAWVDFLVEDHILGIEYKFTTPYIYVHSEERLSELEKHKKESFSLKDYKNGFYKKAKEKQLPPERIPALWKEHLSYVVTQQKDFFLKECERRGVPEAQDLFEQYVKEVTDAA